MVYIPYPNEKELVAMEKCRALCHAMPKFALFEIQHPFIEFWREKRTLLAANGCRVDPYDCVWPGICLICDRTKKCPCCGTFRPGIHGFHLVVEARRLSDNVSVLIEWVEMTSTQYILMTRFSTPESRTDKYNHCLPVLDTFLDPDLDGSAYLVTPYYLTFLPYQSFLKFDWLVSFIDELIEGLVYLHEQGVAGCFCNCDESVARPDRNSYPMFHYYNAFSHAVYLDVGPSGKITSDMIAKGHERFSRRRARDVYMLGDFIATHTAENLNIAWLNPLLRAMRRVESERLTAAETLEYWNALKEGLHESYCTEYLESRGLPVISRPLPRPSPAAEPVKSDSCCQCTIM